MNKVILFGAFDRDNYGDILFAKIFDEYSKSVGKNYKFRYFSLKERDLSHLGGYKTESISNHLNSLNDNDTLVLVGGDVLTVGWYSMYRCFTQNKLALAVTDLVYNVLPWRYKENFFKYLMNGKTSTPWLVTKNDVKGNVKVIYNSVGGSNLKNYSEQFKRNFKEKVNNIDFLSVRDKNLEKSIEEIIEGKKVLLSPDSAFIMSKVFPMEKLENLVSKEIKDLDIIKQKYIVLQTKDTIGIPNVDILVKELKEIYDKFGYSVVLLPIGRAAGHSDHIPLEKIAKKLKTPYFIPKSNTIYDTMYLIGKSELYIGTSLHGAITAYSYGKPHYALTSTVEKLIEFLKTWSIESFLKGVEPHEISKKFEEMIAVDKEEICKKRDELILLIEKNFSSIFEIIEK